MRISFLEIIPKSPWEESLADKLKDGVPTDESVAAIFDAISPLLPTPHKITFELHLATWITASLNELLIFFFNFCNAFISRSIMSLPIDTIFFFIH